MYVVGLWSEKKWNLHAVKEVNDVVPWTSFFCYVRVVFVYVWHGKYLKLHVRTRTVGKLNIEIINTTNCWNWWMCRCVYAFAPTNVFAWIFLCLKAVMSRVIFVAFCFLIVDKSVSTMFKRTMWNQS